MFTVLAFLEFLHSQCSVPMTIEETVYRQFFLGCKAVCIQKAASKYAFFPLFLFKFGGNLQIFHYNKHLLIMFLCFTLKAEGIFRINAENSEEENVRNQLNKGIVPHGIDVHCLSGLIKVGIFASTAGNEIWFEPLKCAPNMRK